MAFFHETVATDEASRFTAFAAELQALQKARAGTITRALHVKRHVGAVAEVVVPDLPEALRVGPFAAATTWPAYVRFSNGAGARQSDRAADVRGVGLKLVGVPGRKVISGLEDKLTQDLLFIQTPSLAFRDPDEFMTFVRTAARGSAAMLLPRLLGAYGFGRGLRILKRLAGMPKPTSLATATFFTAAPISFGATAAKLALFPIGVDSPENTKRPRGDDGLRDDLLVRLATGAISFSLRAQLFVDDATTPIEDASVLWPEARSPFVEIARVTLPQQQIESPAGKAIETLVEAMSFDPWHAVEALRPLGAIMRARAVAYRESVRARGAAPEPDTVSPPARS